MKKRIQQVFQLEKVGGYPIGIVPYIISKNIIVLVLSSLQRNPYIYIHIFLIFQYYKYIYPFANRLVCNLWVKFIQHQISTADFFITFFASKKAATDGHRAEFSEEELQARGGPFRWGRKSFLVAATNLRILILSFFWFICSILVFN